MKFLIDECLTIDLVLTANQEGYEAQHVARVGKAGWKDWNVAKYARVGEFILVTNNACDFLRLYAAELLHPGLVVIIPNVGRLVQQQIFKVAIEVFKEKGEPINQVLEIDLDGDDVTLALYDLPKTSS
jgi:predicted nuclease of predicted toxin-antitoxin system